MRKLLVCMQRTTCKYLFETIVTNSSIIGKILKKVNCLTIVMMYCGAIFFFLGGGGGGEVGREVEGICKGLHHHHHPHPLNA